MWSCCAWYTWFQFDILRNLDKEVALLGKRVLIIKNLKANVTLSIKQVQELQSISTASFRTPTDSKNSFHRVFLSAVNMQDLPTPIREQSGSASLYSLFHAVWSLWRDDEAIDIFMNDKTFYFSSIFTVLIMRKKSSVNIDVDWDRIGNISLRSKKVFNLLDVN